jgi:hypothetical protein
VQRLHLAAGHVLIILGDLRTHQAKQGGCILVVQKGKG